ncbi:MAG: molybdenum cofactor guanylyltransferase [Thermoplasmata archaeon]|nr:molybdenum cofactor guanylyltransferase [Thermoplasmata archaeon]
MDTALILAGGVSSRFGRPKAFVDVAGKPMIRHVIDGITSLTDDVVISVADTKTAQSMQGLSGGAKVVVDRRTGLGPIEGFVRGVEAAGGQRVLVAPCDAPLIRPSLYRLLLRHLGAHEAAVPRFDVIDPVRAVYVRSAVRRVLADAEGLPKSPSALVDRLDAMFVGEDELRTVDPRLDSFVDVNTEGDLAEVLARLRSA